MSTLQTKQYYQRSRIDSDWGTLGRYNQRGFISFPTASPRLSTLRQGQTVLFQTGDRVCQNVDGTMLLEGRIVEI